MSGQLKEVRERITSVKSTQQITKAMKMVSAAKLRKAQEAIVEMRPYADRLDHMLKNILSNLDGDASTSFGTVREINKVCIVVMTSDRGLCGGFNSNIIKQLKTLTEKYAAQREAGNLSIMFLGKKGFDFCKRPYGDCNLISDHVELFSDLSFENISTIANSLMDNFISGEYDHVDVCYTKFRNPAVQFAKAAQFLPVAPVVVDSKADKDNSDTKADYIFEPSKQELLEHLIPTILQTTFQKFLLDTNASQHGARMTAMDKATENAEDLLKDLKINYNKARQEAITKELSEIVGGAAALAG